MQLIQTFDSAASSCQQSKDWNGLMWEFSCFPSGCTHHSNLDDKSDTLREEACTVFFCTFDHLIRVVQLNKHFVGQNVHASRGTGVRVIEANEGYSLIFPFLFLFLQLTCWIPKQAKGSWDGYHIHHTGYVCLC